MGHKPRPQIIKVMCILLLQGQPPSHRTDSCSIFNPLSQELVVNGGKAARPPCSLLADLHILSLPEAQQQPEQVEAAAPQPKWQQVQPHRLSTLQQSTSSSQQQQQGMLPLAGHAGGVVISTGEVAFVGGYRSNAVKEPQPLVQVSTIHRLTDGGSRLVVVV